MVLGSSGSVPSGAGVVSIAKRSVRPGGVFWVVSRSKTKVHCVAVRSPQLRMRALLWATKNASRSRRSPCARCNLRANWCGQSRAAKVGVLHSIRHNCQVVVAVIPVSALGREQSVTRRSMSRPAGLPKVSRIVTVVFGHLRAAGSSAVQAPSVILLRREVLLVTVTDHNDDHLFKIARPGARFGLWKCRCAALIVAVAISACEGAESGDSESTSSGSGSSSTGTDSPEEGAACGQQGPQCAVDDDELFVCESNVWSAQSCQSMCRDLMPSMCSLGCLHGQEGDECLCVPEGPECVGSQCDGLFLRLFPEGTKESCASICAEQGFEIVLGCGFDLKEGSDRCRCLDAATACEVGVQSICTGEPIVPSFGSSEEIASCVGGQWVIEPCVEVCGFEGAGCLSSPEIGALCLCE